jgi:hypothetical protein
LFKSGGDRRIAAVFGFRAFICDLAVNPGNSYLCVVRKFIIIVFGIILFTLQCKAQCGSDTVFVGDTGLVACFSGECISGAASCTSGSIEGGVVGFDPEFYGIIQNGEFGGVMYIYFAPKKAGLKTDTAVLYVECSPSQYCYSPNPDVIYPFSAFALIDSFPKIRPQGWSITMIPDSNNRIWTNHSTLTFDNPIADTTIFSEFSAKTPKGDGVTLQVFDSTTLITQYVALPFVRKQLLNLIFSSQNYLSFDTVIFSTRMQHPGVDSIVSYALPVSWKAPLSVAQNNSSYSSYALPNPFSTLLAIGFTLENAEDVKLQLFDLTGQELRNQEQEFSAGSQSIILDMRDLPSGSYFYVIHGAEWNRSGKVVKIEQ